MNFRACSAISAGRFRKTSAFAIFARNLGNYLAHGKEKVRYPSSLPWDSRKRFWTSGPFWSFEEGKRRGGTVSTNGCGTGLVCRSATRKPVTGWWGRTTHPSCHLGCQRLLVRGASLLEIQRYEEERLANDSTYWLFFELLC